MRWSTARKHKNAWKRFQPHYGQPLTWAVLQLLARRLAADIEHHIIHGDDLRRDADGFLAPVIGEGTQVADNLHAVLDAGIMLTATVCVPYKTMKFYPPKHSRHSRKR